jgi:hypothetical protein
MPSDCACPMGTRARAATYGEYGMCCASCPDVPADMFVFMEEVGDGGAR